MNIQFLGHCYEAGKHDKIWGWIKTSDGPLSFWGRRQGTLAFKRYDSEWTIETQARTKRKKYLGVDPERWSTVLPEDFEGQVMLAVLGQAKYE